MILFGILGLVVFSYVTHDMAIRYSGFMSTDQIRMPHYSFPDKGSSGKGETKYLIYICPKGRLCGGYVDRLRAIRAIYILAELMNRRFGLIFDEYFELGKIYRPNLIHWDTHEIDVMNRSILRINSRQPLTISLIKSANLKSVFQEEVIYFNSDYRLLSQLESNPLHRETVKNHKYAMCPNGFANFYKDLFKPSAFAKVKETQFLSKVKATPSTKLICAHIRMGKTDTIPKDSKQFFKFEKLDGIWKFMKRYEDLYSCRFFVSTDSEKVRSHANAIFGKRVVDIPGPIMHIDRPINRTMAGFQKALMDHRSMQHCDVLVISHGGYGKLGAQLRNTINGLYKFANGKVWPAIYSKDKCNYVVNKTIKT